MLLQIFRISANTCAVFITLLIPAGLLSQIILEIKDSPQRLIDADFCGLSYESKIMLPDANGQYYFSAESIELIAAFRQLDIHSLRIGGNTAERQTVPVPDEAAIDALFAFAYAANTKVIYTLRMEGNAPEESARTARYIQTHYSELLDCFIIGNEPDKTNTYENYYAEWKRFAGTIRSTAFVPDATYCAPTTTAGAPQWAARMAIDEIKTGRIALIGQHYYPGGGSPAFSDNPQQARSEMMSLSWHSRYQQFYDNFVPTALSSGHRVRLNETNNYHTGGVQGASDTFAATIWALDYLYWWAYHNVVGINFHSGQKVWPGDDVVRKNVYTGLTVTDEGLQVLPLGYAIKAFTLSAHGNELLSVTMSSPAADLPFKAYATRDSGSGTIYVTVINGSHGAHAASVDVQINLPKSTTHGSWMQMRGPPNDPTGITLGGSTIGHDGEWSGQWTDIDSSSMAGDEVTAEIPPTTITLFRLEQDCLLGTGQLFGLN